MCAVATGPVSAKVTLAHSTVIQERDTSYQVNWIFHCLSLKKCMSVLMDCVVALQYGVFEMAV